MSPRPTLTFGMWCRLSYIHGAHSLTRHIPKLCTFYRFDDGSVVLRAKDPPTMFRVHRALIARHSEVFRHMFLMPQPEHQEDTEFIEGCPVVDVHDAASDMSGLLRALYDGP